MKRAMIALAIILALLGGMYGAICFTRTQKTVETTVVTEPITVAELHRLVNLERTEAGLQPLILDERLNQSALAKATDMYVDGYYSHVDPVTGMYGYEYITQYAQCHGSENLQTGASDSEYTVIGWMQSTDHREAILSTKYTHVGYAIKGVYVTQHFC